ncbi:MAG: DNA polymerase III subunit epsilon [Rhodoferax sp.]|nr:DNA polymerase III subunit epsilon [Rhodoferax sp.]
MRQIFLDTETTGLNADQGDRVVELACVEMINRKLTGNNLHFYLNPQRDSHEDALRIHGLTTEFLSDKPLFEAVVEEWLAYVQDAEIIIHNAAFDVGFLNAELKRCGKLAFKEYVPKVIDSLVMAKEMYPGKRNNLNALCERLDVDNSGRTLHGALLDAELLADVYINMTRGQHALLMDSAEPPKPVGIQVQNLDWSGIQLPVLQANAEELEAHEQAMQDINKASGGKAVWQ